MNYSKTNKNTLIALAVALSFTGCGGGGGSTSATTPTAAIATVNTTTNQIVPPTDTVQATQTIDTTVKPVYSSAARPFNEKTLQACTPKDTTSLVVNTSPVLGGGVEQIKPSFSSNTNSPFGQKRWTVKAQDGRVYVRGDNTDGLIGLGATAAQNIEVATPLAISRPISFLASATSAIDIDGGLWFWGVDPSTTQKVLSPIKIAGLPAIKKIASGAIGGFLLLAADGTVWTVSNSGFMNANQALNNSNTPTATQVAGLSNIVELIGGDVMLALNTSGQVFSWGSASSAALGRVLPTIFDGTTPAPIPNLPPIKALFVNTAVFAISTTGGVFTWGYAYPRANLETQVVTLKKDEPNNFGIDQVKSELRVPVLHPTLNTTKFISQTASYAAAVKEDGSVFVWGSQNGARFFAYDPAALLGVKGAASAVNIIGSVDEFKFIAFNQQVWLKDGKLGVINASGATTLDLDACAPVSNQQFKTVLPAEFGALAITTTGEVWEVVFDTNPNRGDGLLYFVTLKRVF
jgi:hypothetical protein